jgi:uncharacterized protein (UPF0210 family)
MKIRSITSFFTPEKQNKRALEPLAAFSRELQGSFEKAGFEVESTRLAAPPTSAWLKGSLNEQIPTVQRLETLVKSLGWAYLSVGPATPDAPETYQVIPDLLAATQDVFFSAVISDRQAVYPPAVAACAEIVSYASTISPDGFANLRFAALGNVPPHAPFFPAAYHAADESSAFSLAMECADEAVKAFAGATSLEAARDQFIGNLEEKAAALLPVCRSISSKYNVTFKGFDFSPAPFPEDWCSLGKAFELLGLDHIGGSGSLAAAAFIADALDRGNWPRAGFNGLMLAVMEDSVLAARAAQGLLSIKDLLLYSAVCGTGLDTIPLPGDTSTDELTGVLLDLATLATRLCKPLTARLMPIPGKKVGDSTVFNFGYFANSRVMKLDGQKIGEPLRKAETIRINPRKSQ